MWDKNTKTDVQQVINIFDKEKSGIYTVKPRIFLKRVEGLSENPISLNMLMPSSDIGSITLLEGAMLTALAKIIGPNIIFEFGTYLGYTTALLAKNTPMECLISSIDLGDVSRELASAGEYSKEDLLTNDKKNDDYLRLNQSVRGEYYLKSLTAHERSRVSLIKMNSNLFDVDQAGLGSIVDMVFIDGGHDATTIESDTKNALKMIGEDGVVIWHDFNSTVHHDVTDYLKNFGSNYLVFHIESTMLALHFKGDTIKKFVGNAF